MDMDGLERFLLKARAQTYAAAQDKSAGVLPGSVQYEYSDRNYLYQDTYFTGNGIFSGLETIYFKDKPVWSMSYFGNFTKMTEEQTDKMLRRALIDNQDTTRMYGSVEKDYGEFTYRCEGAGDIDEVSGTEEIHAGGERVYYFYYAGGFIG